MDYETAAATLHGSLDVTGDRGVVILAWPHTFYLPNGAHLRLHLNLDQAQRLLDDLAVAVTQAKGPAEKTSSPI